MRIKYSIFFLIFFYSWFGAISQRSFVTNQYNYDLFLMNPADAGSNRDCYKVGGVYQRQWFGTDLAPTTQLLSFQAPLSSNVGSGTYLYNDRNGHNAKLSFQQSFAVEVILRQNRRGFTSLLLGLSALLEQTTVDERSFYEGAAVIDPSVTGGIESGFGFNANTGVILKVNKFKTGFSVTNLLPQNNPMYDSQWEPELPMDMHFFAHTTIKIPDYEVFIDPGFYFRVNSLEDRRLDLNLRLQFPTMSPDLDFWGLVSYRRNMDHQLGKDLGFATTFGVMYRSLNVGIEHQYGLTSAQNHFGSAMVLVAGYRFCTNRSRLAMPCSEENNGLGAYSGGKRRGIFTK